jgi:phosphohistidine swiveling domain-containing protein
MGLSSLACRVFYQSFGTMSRRVQDWPAMSEPLGRGLLVSGSACEGELRHADDVPQVLALVKHARLDDVILLCESASATAVVPLLAKVKGIVCRSGGPTSHLAIVSREFGLPAVMGAELAGGDELEGRRVRLDDDGEITAA